MKAFDVILEFVDVQQLLVYIFLVVIPIIIFLRNFFARRFFSTFELVYLVIGSLAVGYFESLLFTLSYWVICGVYIFWWSIKFQQYREENPDQFTEYKKFFTKYYGDDLNQDGIKDAFEHWEIAHDPRFFWIFGSKLEKRKRKNQMEAERAGYFAGFFSKNAKGSSDQFWQGAYEDSRRRQEQNARDGRNANGSEYTRRSRKDYGPYSRTNFGSYGRTTKGAYGTGNGYGSGNGYSTGNSYGAGYGSNDSYSSNAGMSEEEKKVAAQHAFAKRHNLRYFAMCESKSEAKKLYHKYAAKFHPDNALTGDKEKFIRIDEEYNRFCEISEIS